MTEISAFLKPADSTTTTTTAGMVTESKLET